MAREFRDEEGQKWIVWPSQSKGFGRFESKGTKVRRCGRIGATVTAATDAQFRNGLKHSWALCLLCDDMATGSSPFCIDHSSRASPLHEAATTLCDRAGAPLDEAGCQLLFLHPKRLADYDSDFVEQTSGRITQTMFSGFFSCATEGCLFLGPCAIELRMGRTLEQNYPEASEPFLRFAASYWTLKLLLDEALEEWPCDDRPGNPPRDWLLFGLLSEVETQVASVFFPTPGPVRIPVEAREAKQRELLTRYAPGIDVESFITGNPILIRDRKQDTI